MSTISSDLLSPMNGASAVTPGTSSGLTENSPEAIQNRFLKLLTVQMKNQDPTKPMDNSELTTQLAQLSTVSGISKLNTTLESLMANSSSSQSLQSANMIGHSVLAPGKETTLASTSTINPDGTTTTTKRAVFGVQLDGNVDSLKINIRDASGKVVQSLDMGSQSAGTLPIVWDGATDSGKPAPDGQYTFEVEGTSAGSPVSATGLSFGTVSSVTTGADGVKLNVSNIGTIKTTDVVQIL